MKRAFNSGSLFALVLLLLLSLPGMAFATGEAAAVSEVPVKGKVTMVDIGASKCIPCKMMAPILQELQKEYGVTGKAAIIFIDVWETRDKDNLDVRTIPTQIFFNADGREVYRHEGFLDKKEIVKTLEGLGVQ